MKSRRVLRIPAQTSGHTFLATLVLSCLFPAALAGIGHVLNRRRLPAGSADAGLVFGTGVYWKAQTRIDMAAQLFHQGVVRFLIVSGGVLVPGMAIAEAAWFRDQLMRRGVPSERILLEDRATNTAENVEYALPIIQAQHFRSVVLIMSDFEGLRAHLTAKRAWLGQGLAIYDCHARSTGHWNPWTWWLSREGWSLTWYTVPRLIRYRLWAYMWPPTRAIDHV